MDVVHKHEFNVVLVPADINDPVEIIQFSARSHEREFTNYVKCWFSNERITEKKEKKFVKSLESGCLNAGQNLVDKTEKQEENDIRDDENLKSMLKCASVYARDGTYQIVPLTLPSVENSFTAINCYIDAIGKIKKLQINSRASRITSDQINGDCFISKSFDDDKSEFQRLPITLSDYEELQRNPPEKKGRWNQEDALKQLLTSNKDPSSSPKLTDHSKPLVSTLSKCENCGKSKNVTITDTSGSNESGSGSKLFKCSRCQKVAYCGVSCQKEDWEFHKRICSNK